MKETTTLRTLYVIQIEYISDGNQIEVTCKRSTTFFAFLLMFLGKKAARTTVLGIRAEFIF